MCVTGSHCCTLTAQEHCKPAIMEKLKSFLKNKKKKKKMSTYVLTKGTSALLGLLELVNPISSLLWLQSPE